MEEGKQSGFCLLNPQALHNTLNKYLVNQSIKHIMIFQNIEGSVVAKASSSFGKKNQDDVSDPQRSLNSYAAVLANICHEYIEFGLEAFDNNKFK